MHVTSSIYTAQTYTQQSTTQSKQTASFDALIKTNTNNDSAEVAQRKGLTSEQLKWRQEQKEEMMKRYFALKESVIESEEERGEAFTGWAGEYSKRTEANMFENAPEFEAFVYEWIDKGDTYREALGRASFYAQAGLLEYGDQRAKSIAGGLQPGDKKEHGLHKIDNDLLKNTIKDFLDNSDIDAVANFIGTFFTDNPDTPKGADPFQDLLDKFGVTLQDMHEKNKTTPKYEFDGDITITEEMSNDKKAFIYDTLIEFFEYHLTQYKDKEENFDKEYYRNEAMYQSFIDQLKSNVAQEKYNLEHGNKDEATLSQYTHTLLKEIQKKAY